MWAATIAALIILAASVSLIGAEPDASLARKIKTEIENLEKRIKEGEAGQRNAVDQLQDIDRKIELRRRLIVEQEKGVEASNHRVLRLGEQIERVTRELEALSVELAASELNLERLGAEAARRMAYFYKRITGTRLALLAGVENLNDMARRRKYFASIEGFDRRSLQKITAQRNEIETDKSQREELRNRLSSDQTRRLAELDRYRSLLKDKRREEAVQLAEREHKSKLLENIVNDNNLLRALLEERRKALEDIEREIARQQLAEEKRPVPEFLPETPFQSLFGRLSPPLRSLTVAQPFGPTRHPKLGTITINPGIDFKARPGEPVFSVAGGKVTRVAWLRGFGNTVIVAHGQGYYTVYAKLEQVIIGEGQVIRPGQTIGQVADAGESSEFHFEVWSKREKQDPMKWLGR